METKLKCEICETTVAMSHCRVTLSHLILASMKKDVCANCYFPALDPQQRVSKRLAEVACPSCRSTLPLERHQM